MAFFPFFKEMKGASGLIVGGGRVALRKAEALLPYGPSLRVIAPELLPEFYKLDVRREERAFEDSDLEEGTDFVIAASADSEINSRVARLCREQRILVNVADNPALCTFLFPSLIHRGRLSVGISTGGASPTAAVWLRKQFEQLLPEQIEPMLEWLFQQRTEQKERIAREERGRRFAELFWQCLKAGGPPDEAEARDEGSVCLVGAGCGTRDWMTEAGLRRLRECGAVVYDALIDRSLLEEAPEWAERIYVGKRGQRASAKQEEIQEILIRLASEGKRVVRLKVGDPFVIGRGGEEIEALNRRGIPWSVVPGISSALAIPEEAGIPLTYRGVSRSIHIMTAHTQDHALRRDLGRFAGLEGTLVILMGIGRLKEIAELLMAHGRSGRTPAAVRSGGNAAHPYRIIGTLENIAALAQKEQAGSPGIILVGETAALGLKGGARFPLSGVRVGLTGTDAFQERLRGRLLALEALPVSLMSGVCRETDVKLPWDRITDQRAKWIVFTSVQGVRFFFDRRRRAGVDSRRFAACRFAVIGGTTGEELRAQGFQADLCPKEFTAEGLAEELLARNLEREPVYLFCSAQGRTVLSQRLEENGIPCFRWDLYDTQLRYTGRAGEELDYVLFGSAGGVRALAQSGIPWRKEWKAICIGPVCAQAFSACFGGLGQEPAVAAAASADGLLEALTGQAEGGAMDDRQEQRTAEGRRK